MVFHSERETNNQLNIIRMLLLAFAVYVLLIVSFYFLAGDQLHFRTSRGNLEMPTADAGAVELSQGVTVEQLFHARIQRLQAVSVQWEPLIVQMPER